MRCGALRWHGILCGVQDEISEMKRKFKIMSHQIEQLKEEIAAKDLALVKEHFDHMKVSASGCCGLRKAVHSAAALPP